MTRLIIYWSLMAAVLWLSWFRGDRETRVAALICLIATIGSLHMLWPFTIPGSVIKPVVAAIDIITFAAFVVIALRSERFWPLWLAGLQLTTLLSHMMKLLRPDLVAIAYEAAMKFWSYPLLVILGIAAWRTGLRERDRSIAT